MFNKYSSKIENTRHIYTTFILSQIQKQHYNIVLEKKFLHIHY